MKEYTTFLNTYQIPEHLMKLWEFTKSIHKSFKPHPIQRTQKETILSIWKKIHIRSKSKQNTIAGYVK